MGIRHTNLGAALVCLLGAGCDPGSWMDAPKQPPTPAETPAEDTAPEAAAEREVPATSAIETLSADLGRSKIGFAVAKATGEHIAVFEDFEGKTTLKKGQPTRLEITIMMASVKSDREGLTKHLKSSDFFDVDRFPTSTFVSTAFRRVATEEMTHELDGKLTLHGVTHPLTFPAQILVEKDAARGKAQLTIDPRDYGIKYPGLREELVDTNVLLDIELTFPRRRN